MKTRRSFFKTCVATVVAFVGFKSIPKREYVQSVQHEYELLGLKIEGEGCEYEVVGKMPSPFIAPDGTICDNNYCHYWVGMAADGRTQLLCIPWRGGQLYLGGEFYRT